MIIYLEFSIFNIECRRSKSTKKLRLPFLKLKLLLLTKTKTLSRGFPMAIVVPNTSKDLLLSRDSS